MPLDQNIIPPNNLRLPDALTVKHGPTHLLARFLLAADKACRRRGVLLRVRYDFDELLYVNRHYSARKLWYPILDAFNPERADLSPEDCVWVSGEDEQGDIVATAATRAYDWAGTNLKEQARTVWYGRDLGQPCVVTSEEAEAITGVMAWGYGSWVRQDYRGRHLSFLIPRVIKAYVASRWPVDFIGCFISMENFKRGLAKSYGYRHVIHGFHYPGSPLGEQCVAYEPIQGYYEALANFMASGDISASDLEDVASSSDASTRLEHIVTKTSSEVVFHGSMSRS
jgi:hypothetical protein